MSYMILTSCILFAIISLLVYHCIRRRIVYKSELNYKDNLDINYNVFKVVDKMSYFSALNDEKTSDTAYTPTILQDTEPNNYA